MSDVTAQAFREAAARITNYLRNGGLFNPELMEHDKVRQLLLDCREHVLAAAEQREQLEKLEAQLAVAMERRVKWLNDVVDQRNAGLQQIATLTAERDEARAKLAQ